jgi:diguanylate cyclase (GGDEF)-like protein/PAS domain S-box-containing protein
VTVLRWPDGRRDGAAGDPATVPIEALGVAAWRVDGATRVVRAVNDAALALLGLARDEVIGAPAESLLATPEDAAFWAESALAPTASLRSRTTLARLDGQLRHVERWVRPAGDGRGFIVTLVDLTEQHAAEQARERLVAELQATLESTADALLVTDLGGRVQAWNRRFAELWEMPESLLRARDADAVFAWMAREIVEPADDARRVELLRTSAHAGAQDRLTLRNGRVVERVSLPQRHGELACGRVYSFRDLTERIEADRRVEQMSFTDALTGLPNRRYLTARLAPAAALALREGFGFALLYLDLDHFKQVNDSFGPDTGDRVLREVAARLRAGLREGDLIARVGGDQFVLLLHRADADGAERGARRVLDVVAAPFEVDGSAFTVTCSVGVALFPRDAHQPEELVRHAETAMQHAKQGGRAGYRMHRAQAAGTDLRLRLELDHAMRLALASNRFRLHYQPQVALADGRVVGVEALIRWRDPERGDVPPGAFIPVAEDTGFIVAIGDWVLERAARQAAHWHAQGLAVPVAVNVSALQFQHEGFVDRVAQVLREHALPPHLLELELTESILLRDAHGALERLHALARLGVQLSIDDFGTGYSSLAYLKRFPIGRLKIDRGFVRGLPGDDGDAGIVRAIVQIAHALGLKVIAEGVETEAQREFLAAAGCDEIQGWLIAPALDVAQVARHLRVRG